MPLEQSHDDKLHQIRVEEIFPGVVDSFSSKAARAGQPGLIEGGVTGRPRIPTPPVPDNVGDFVTATGNPMG